MPFVYHVHLNVRLVINHNHLGMIGCKICLLVLKLKLPMSFSIKALSVYYFAMPLNKLIQRSLVTFLDYMCAIIIIYTTALPDGMWQYSISLDFSSNYRRPSCLMCGRGASGLLSFTFTYNCPGNFIASCFIIKVLLRRLKKVKDLVLYTCLFLS
jgi:hypothetical protein